MTAPRRAVLYFRLSRESDVSTSIQGQDADLSALAAREGWDVVATFTDEGLSGGKRRKNADEAVRLLRDGEVDILAAYAVDRFSRMGIGEDAELVRIVRRSPAARRARVVFMREGIDSASDPKGWALRFVIASELAHSERELIVERRKAATARLKAGSRFAGGVRPYGYDSVPNPKGPGRVLAVNPDEAAIIRRMADEVLGGASIYAVTDRLNLDLARGIGAPPRRATQWHPTTVKRILRSDAVLGRVRAGGVHTVDADGRMKTEKRPDVIRDENGLPVVFWTPILTVAEVEQLRALTERSATPGRSEATLDGIRNPHRRLLSGMLTCPSCRGRMIAKSRHTTGRPVYTCNARARGQNCDRAVTVEALRIEAEVERQFLAAAGHLEVVERRESRGEVLGIAELEEAIRDTTEALRDAPAADFSALVSRLTSLRDERERLGATPSAPTIEIVRTGERFADRWAQLDAVGRRLLLLTSGVSVHVAPAARRGHWDPSRVTVEFPVDREDYDAA